LTFIRFRGCLSSDFYAGYNAYHGRHQRCWVRLLRDLPGTLRVLREGRPAEQTVARWAEAVRALYDQARAALRRPRPRPPSAAERRSLFLHFEERARKLGLTYAKQAGHPCHTLAHRLLRHHGELFQFVRTPGVSPDNNPAERSLRHLVITRKISGGGQSPGGTQTWLALASFFGTWQARGLNPFTECLALLCHTLSFHRV